MHSTFLLKVKGEGWEEEEEMTKYPVPTEQKLPDVQLSLMSLLVSVLLETGNLTTPRSFLFPS